MHYQFTMPKGAIEADWFMIYDISNINAQGTTAVCSSTGDGQDELFLIES